MEMFPRSLLYITSYCFSQSNFFFFFLYWNYIFHSLFDPLGIFLDTARELSSSKISFRVNMPTLYKYYVLKKMACIALAHITHEYFLIFLLIFEEK